MSCSVENSNWPMYPSSSFLPSFLPPSLPSHDAEGEHLEWVIFEAGIFHMQTMQASLRWSRILHIYPVDFHGGRLWTLAFRILLRQNAVALLPPLPCITWHADGGVAVLRRAALLCSRHSAMTEEEGTGFH